MSDAASDPAGQTRPVGTACRSGMSVRPDTHDAAMELADRLAPIEKPDLMIIFATPEHSGRMGTVQDTLRHRSGVRHVVAVTAEGGRA